MKRQIKVAVSVFWLVAFYITGLNEVLAGTNCNISPEALNCNQKQQDTTKIDRTTDSNQCNTFTDRCTGFGTRQCVTAPVSMTPDAETIEYCCDGWFQYPYIEVCEGEPPKRGCGFCLW
ncbi:hypothetical protein [Nitrosomonas sp.]|uniref:hypothetical protein n=1 Tax=Nitrosomonas sp. TaxID=42353 RepID=UPI002630349E|nr:hypothetical protein [Nitrosomonas sp.]MCW5600038.1 hypothetical protein [Nitrosomonas sp.]